MLKKLTWLLSALLSVVLATAATLMLSDRALFALVDRLLPLVTPYRITLDAPRVHWRAGRLEIATVQVHQADSEGAPLLAIEDLSVSGAPRELLQLGIARADVSAGAVLVYINATDSSPDPNPAEWLQYSALFPRKLTIGTLHVVSRDTTVNVFPFSNLYGGWQDSSHFVASAGSDYTGMPLILALSIERRAISASRSRLAIHGALKPQQGSSRIELDGELTATDETVSYHVDLHAEYERVQDFLNAIEEGAYPFAGTLTLDGTLTGDLEHYDLDVRQLALDNGEAYFFTAEGTVTKARESTAQLDVSARGRMASVDQILDLVDLDIGQIGEASAELRLGGPLTAPMLDAFAIHTRNKDGLRLSVTPRDGAFALQQRALLPGQVLAVGLSAPTLAAIEPWVGSLPVEIGAWNLQLALSQREGAFHLQDMLLSLGNTPTLRGSVRGSVGSVRLVANGMPELSDIDVAIEADSEDAGVLLAGLTPDARTLPDLQTLRLSGRLSGSLDALSIDNARVAATGTDLLVEARELNALLRPADTAPLQRAEADIDVTLASMTPLDRLELPAAVDVLDNLQGRGHLSFGGGRLSLSGLSASSATLGGSLHVRGDIADALVVDGLAVELTAQGIPLTRIAGTALDTQGEGWAALPGLLSGSAQLSGSKNALAIKDIDLSLLGSESAGATLQGQATLVDGTPLAQVEAAYRLDDRVLIQALTGQDLAPGSGTVVLDYQPERIVMALHSLMGDSDISAVVNATREGEAITGLDVDLNIPRLYLPDLVGTPRAEALQAESDDPAVNAVAEGDFHWRESIPEYPIRLDTRIDEIVGDNSSLEGFTFTLSGRDRRFILEHFDIDYAGGSAVFRGVADLASPQIGVSLAGSADSLPVTELAADLGYAGDIEGALSVLGGITAQGDSVDALVRSLSGRMAVAIAEGHIEGAAYDLLATDLLGWLLSGGLLRDATDFHCAAVNFNLRQGTATSDRLYVLTENMIASGDASIDLAGQRLDVRIQPRARRRSVQMPSSISVRGDLAGPSISISPIAATMDTTAKILFLVPDLLLRLFGLGPDAEGQVQPCTVDG